MNLTHFSTARVPAVSRGCRVIDIRDTRRSALAAAVGLLFVCHGSPASSETLILPPCGINQPITQNSYSGLVEVTVSGTATGGVGVPFQDAFYADVESGTPIVDPGNFRVVRASASTCTCTECGGPSLLADLLVGDYPVFRADHTYTVVLDLPWPADQLRFGTFDCACGDNSGGYSLSVVAATTSTSTTTTTSTTSTLCVEAPDSDGDGEADATDHCSGTGSGERVDPAGCSHAQFCASLDATTRDGQRDCKKADWRNDEPQMRGRDRDCTVDRGATGATSDDACVPYAVP